MAIELNEAEMRRLLTSRDGPVWNQLFTIGRRVQQRAIVLCPVGSTGNLANSIVLEMDTENGAPVARVGTNMQYAIWVHEGTGIYGPHKTPIRPRTAKLLKWPVTNTSGRGRVRYKGGKTAAWISKKQVNGMPARPFLRKALEQVTGQS